MAEFEFESSASSADWDWTMDEYAELVRPSSISNESPSPTKQLSDTTLYSTLQVKQSRMSYSKDLDDIIQTHDYYLHYLIFTCQIASISQFMHIPPRNIGQIINYPDFNGNTPLFLAVKLCAVSREYLSIVRMLVEHGANLHAKDANGWTMIDEAVSQKNRELVAVLFEYLYIEKMAAWDRNRQTAQVFLAALPHFSVEIKWEFSSNVIPLVSKIGPHDVCKLWKVGDKLRFDSTLVGWKNLRCKRRNISLVFDEDLFIVNHSKKIVVNPLEELDNEETNEVINDIMNSEPVQGSLALLGHSINEVKTWRGNLENRVIGRWKAFKHKIQFRTHVSITRKTCKQEITEEYFNTNTADKMPKPSFKHRKRSHKGKSKTFPKQSQENSTSTLKNNTLYCWLCYDFPITIRELLSVLEVIKSANKNLDKLYDFLENEGIASLLPENSFPIKIEVPIALGITAKVTFLNFTILGEEDDKEIFRIPDYNRVSRRIGQKTLTSPKKRMLFTNLVA
jgi:ankyrin repeat domain-containing protein 13